MFWYPNKNQAWTEYTLLCVINCVEKIMSKIPSLQTQKRTENTILTFRTSGTCAILSSFSIAVHCMRQYDFYLFVMR